MTEQPYDPETLATRLDELLSGANPALEAESDPLLETALRLHQAPRPALSAEALVNIEQQLLQHPSGPSRGVRGRTWITLGLVAGILAGLVLIAVILSGNSEDTPAATDEPAELLGTEEATDAPEPVPDSSADEPLPDVAAVLELPPVIVIEGPVVAIDETSITIHVMTFDASHDPTLLYRIETGDIVRLEGAALGSGEETLFFALTITLLEDANGEPPSVLLPAEQGVNTSATSSTTGSSTSTSGTRATRAGSASEDTDRDRGHGNDADNDDEDNPGRGRDGASR